MRNLSSITICYLSVRCTTCKTLIEHVVAEGQPVYLTCPHGCVSEMKVVKITALERVPRELVTTPPLPPQVEGG